jgi:hypothetical protein
LYFKNDESPIDGESDISIDAIALGIDNLGTQAGLCDITVVRNPTGASFSTDVPIRANRTFSSNVQLSGSTEIYKGAEGATLSGGNDFAVLGQTTGSRGFYTIGVLLGRGNSIGIKINTHTTAGTTRLYAAMILHRTTGRNHKA